MMDRNKDLYKVLGISRDADVKEIRNAYKRLAKIHHPDRNIDKLTSENLFKEIQEAYETLKDSEKRRKYDDELARVESTQNSTFININQLEDLAFGMDEYGWLDEIGNNIFWPINSIDEDLEILLSRSEAKRGGQLSIDLPSYFGFGFGFYSSPRRKFTLRVPAGVKNKEVKNIFVPELDFWIRVRFKVA